MAAATSTKRGWSTAHCNAWNPPIDGPTTARRWVTPSRWSSAYCDATMSPNVMSGNCPPYRRPVAGSMLAGPVLP